MENKENMNQEQIKEEKERVKNYLNLIISRNIDSLETVSYAGAMLTSIENAGPDELGFIDYAWINTKLY